MGNRSAAIYFNLKNDRMRATNLAAIFRDFAVKDYLLSLRAQKTNYWACWEQSTGFEMNSNLWIFKSEMAAGEKFELMKGPSRRMPRRLNGPIFMRKRWRGGGGTLNQKGTVAHLIWMAGVRPLSSSSGHAPWSTDNPLLLLLLWYANEPGAEEFSYW